MTQECYTTKQQLALAYAPELKPTSALRRLARWLHNNPMLMNELKAQGYREKQKFLKKNELRIIFKYIGRPRNGHSQAASCITITKADR